MPSGPNLTLNGPGMSSAMVSVVSGTTPTSIFTTCACVISAPYIRPSGPNSGFLSPPRPWAINSGGSTNVGSISYSVSVFQGSVTNIRPSAENTIELTPKPIICVVTVPSGVMRPISPVNICDQYMDPSGPKFTSSGPFTPRSGPIRSTICPRLTSRTAIPAMEHT